MENISKHIELDVEPGTIVEIHTGEFDMCVDTQGKSLITMPAHPVINGCKECQ